MSLYLLILKKIMWASVCYYSSALWDIYLFLPLQLPSRCPCKLNQQLGQIYDQSRKKNNKHITRSAIDTSCYKTSTASGGKKGNNKICSLWKEGERKRSMTSPARRPRCSDQRDRRRLKENFPAFHGFPPIFEFTSSLSSISTPIWSTL